LFIFVVVDNFSQLFSFYTQLETACFGLIMSVDITDCCCCRCRCRCRTISIWGRRNEQCYLQLPEEITTSKTKQPQRVTLVQVNEPQQ